MNRLILVILLSCTVRVSLHAQGISNASQSPVVGIDYSVVETGLDYQIWQGTNYETTPSGQVIPHVHRYTQLESGLNFTNSQTGRLTPSREEIDILSDGSAVAIQGQHQAYFPGDIYDGVIELVTPDGRHLKSRPVGLSYDDGTNSVLLGQLTNSIGVLVGNNEVIYPNAFSGINADIRYTYRKSGFEQDIILHEQPPVPQSLGLNPDSSRLQVLTEFFDPPQPRNSINAHADGERDLALNDQTLDFQTMRMVPGTTFLLGANSTRAAAQVGKTWLLVNGRQILVEEVPVDAIASGLATLPTARNE